MAVIIHEKVTIAKPSLFVKDLLCLVNAQTGNPVPIQINAETRNPLRSRSVSPKPIEIKIGTTIVIPIIAKRAPRIFNRVLIFMRQTFF